MCPGGTRKQGSLRPLFQANKSRASESQGKASLTCRAIQSAVGFAVMLMVAIIGPKTSGSSFERLTGG